MSYKVKVSIIGDFGVGKSSILNTLNNNSEFCCQSTLGVDFFNKNFNYENQSYKFHIWDTAGQERFRAIVRSYFRDLDVVILVFDVTDIYALDNLEKWDTDLEYINTNPNIIKILVGNKIDSPDRYISAENAQKKANKFKYKYLETTCKDKKTIDNLFENIVKIIYQKNITQDLKLKIHQGHQESELEKNKKINRNNKKKFFFCNIL